MLSLLPFLLYIMQIANIISATMFTAVKESWPTFTNTLLEGWHSRDIYSVNFHVALGWLAKINMAQTAYKLKNHTIITVSAWGLGTLEMVNQVAQSMAILAQDQYHTSFQSIPQRVSIGIRVSVNPALLSISDLRYKFISIAYRYPQLAAWWLPEQLSLAELWACAAHILLIFLLVRFLYSLVSSTFTQRIFYFPPDPIHQLSNSTVITSIHISCSRVTRLLSDLPKYIRYSCFITLEILAIPVFIIHQFGYSNLPPRKPGESIYFRYTSVLALTPLWIFAVTAAMVLFTLGAVVDFVDRTVKRLFTRNSKQTACHQLDVERAQPEGITNSAEEMTRIPGAWGSAEVWDHLRQEQGAFQRERELFDAEKAAWKLEEMEEKRAIELEKRRLGEERLKLQAERQVGANAKAELESIILSFVERSRQSSFIIEQLRNRVDMLPQRRTNLGHPTPPGSPKIERASTAAVYPLKIHTAVMV